MLAGIGLLLFIYYPFIGLFLFPQKLQSYSHVKGLYIQIPKINAEAPLVENVDPWNETEYLNKLRGGVAIAKGTGLPGDNRTSYLFAHSSDVPWDITRYNTAFFRLGELKRGDIIKIFRDGKELDFVVYDEKTIWPNNVEFLNDAIKDQSKSHPTIILQTCTPIGTDWQRLLLFAKLKE